MRALLLFWLFSWIWRAFHRFLEHHCLMIIFSCKPKVVIFATWRVCLFWTCTYKTFLFELADSWSNLNQRIDLCEVSINSKIQAEGGFRPRPSCLVSAFQFCFLSQDLACLGKELSSVFLHCRSQSAVMENCVCSYKGAPYVRL